MPGGRLTREDRDHIAAGLAQGLEYAEIGRRLARPTSTITREVARNGGPAGYRADHAEHATRRRARRRPPAPPEQDPGDRDRAEVADLVARFTALMVHTGLPRMAARVLTCLVVTDAGALTAAELARRLRVSPASVSKAVAYLENLDVVRRERAPGRRERYLIDDDVWLRAWLTNARTHARWAETAARGAEILGPDTPAGERLRRTSAFFGGLSEDMSAGPAEADTLTLLAALAHAGTPRTVEDLATALDWPRPRVTAALQDAERRTHALDPFALGRVGAAYTVTAAPHRLTERQRAALDGR